jgi:hypothetical protein
MKKFIFFGGFLFFITYFFLKNKNHTSEDSSQAEAPSLVLNNQITQKASTADSLTQKEEFTKKLVNRAPASYPEIKKYLPKNFPPQLKKRWEQKIVNEDERYITSQLYLDGRNLEEYFFKWEKMGNEINLIAGDLPVINELTASFPSKAIQSERISDLLAEEAKLISSKEVWMVNSDAKLMPFLKIEVQRIEKPKRTNGHEYWIYDILNNSVSKIIQADRY